jgi:diacylglycerol O-acyltransferase
MGREVIRLLPVPPIGLQLRIVIAILSYADRLVFGITADYDGAPDVDELASGIERAVAHMGANQRDPNALHRGGDARTEARVRKR